MMAEREVNDRLRAEDPAAFEAKMRAQLPTSKCCLCGETFNGYGHNARPPRARRGRGVRRVQRGDRGAAATHQVVLTVAPYVAGHPALRALRGTRGPRARVGRSGRTSRLIMTAGAGDM